MSELPDFSAMSKQEIADWFLTNDTSALIARSERAKEPARLASTASLASPRKLSRVDALHMVSTLAYLLGTEGSARCRRPAR